MKHITRKLFGTIVLLMGPVVVALSQPQPPSNNDVINGGGQALNCPVGNGYWLLIAFAVGYAAYKVWQIRKAEQVA